MLNIAAGTSSYTINNSLRFRSSATAYLSRTPASAGNQQKWTWSGWVKRGEITRSISDYVLIASRPSSGSYTLFSLRHSTAVGAYGLIFSDGASGSDLTTAAVFRDVSAWYHIICAVDTTQATASNRVKIYVNGVQQTISGGYTTYPTQNTNTVINSTNPHNIGRDPYDTPSIFDGYMADVYLIDGQQLTPSSFGQTSATTGVWQPKQYTGTYGTNGFYLPLDRKSTRLNSSHT
mgnify:FL=1